MVSLIAKTPCEGLLPVSVGTVTLQERLPGRITSVAPFADAARQVDRALAALGLGWPEPNRAIVRGEAAILWTGRGQAFLFGAEPAGLPGLAALTDQSDAWAAMTLAGPPAEAVLARLVPIDLRARSFAPGHVARTGLGHMMSILHRVEETRFDICVFRSMAATAVHELEIAMRSVEARSHV